MLTWWKNLRAGARVDQELDAELRAYVDLLTEEYRAAGLGPETARRRALLEAGGIETVKERVRDVRSGVRLESLWGDLLFGRCASAPEYALVRRGRDTVTRARHRRQQRRVRSAQCAAAPQPACFTS